MILTENEINKCYECCCNEPRNCEECPLRRFNDCQIKLRKDSGELLFTYQAIFKRITDLIIKKKNLLVYENSAEKIYDLRVRSFAKELLEVIKEELGKL